MCDNPASYRAKRIRALAPENELDLFIPAGGYSADHWYQFCNEVDEGVWTSVAMYSSRRCSDGWCWVMTNYYDGLRGPIVLRRKTISRKREKGCLTNGTYKGNPEDAV